VIVAVTKTDTVERDQLPAHLLAVGELGTWAEIVPVSAVTDDQTTLLADLILARFPEGPALYPDGHLTDEADEVLVAELVREAALEGLTDELPHSLAVLVEEMVPREGRDDFLEVRVTLYVERPSQKGILIGHNGARMKDVGIKARRQIEPLLGMRINLDLRVTVAKDWQRDPKQLRRLGF
jgi:GTP-binding protein Era